MSPARERILGCPPEQIVGRPASSLQTLEESSETAMDWMLSGSGTPEFYVRAFREADGSAVTLLQLDRRLVDAAGKVSGIRTVLTETPSPPVSGPWPRPVPAEPGVRS